MAIGAGQILGRVEWELDLLLYQTALDALVLGVGKENMTHELALGALRQVKSRREVANAKLGPEGGWFDIGGMLQVAVYDVDKDFKVTRRPDKY